MKKYFILLLSWPLFAAVQNLELNEALRMLQKSNLELKISRFNEQMKAYDTQMVEGQNYGKVEVSVSAMRSNDAGNVFGFKLQSREATFGDFGFSDFLTPPPGTTDILAVQPDELNYPQARNHFLSKATYSLPLYTGGKLSEYTRISEALQGISRWDTQKMMNAKIFQTKKAFYDISLVENYIANLSQIIQNVQRLETSVKMMAKEGYAQEIDLLEVQARAAEAQSMYNQAKLNKTLAYQFLSFLLNTEVSSIKKVNDMAPMPSVVKDEIETNNIDIQQAKLGVQISQMGINVEKGNYLPTLGAFGAYGSADNVLWNEFAQKDSYTVGLQLSWNIFNGGSDKASLEKAKVNYLKAQDQLSLAKSGIALQVKKLETEILSKNADVKSFTKQLYFAKKVYENYQERYKEGMASISDVLMKQSKELEILLKLLTIKNERNTKIFELNSILNTEMEHR